jgi:osmotically-inducible protein OsmY
MNRRAWISLAVLFTLAAAGLTAAPKVLTDEYVTDQVRIKLASDAVVKGGALGITVVNGVVTLTGTVETKEQLERAPKLAKKVKGVKQVISKIALRDKNAPK